MSPVLDHQLGNPIILARLAAYLRSGRIIRHHQGSEP